MAQVPIPERGQPLDVTYIYKLAETINDVSKQVASSSSNYSSLDTVTSGKQNVKTSELRIVGNIVPVASNEIITAGQSKDFNIGLSPAFKFAPIVSATVVNTSGSASGSDVSVTITAVSSSAISGKVKFNVSGQLSVSVHIISMGIAN